MALCLVRRIRCGSGSFCILLWVAAEAFGALGHLFVLLCMPLGRKARSQGKLWGAFGAAVRTLAILLALQSIEWRWPGQGHCYFAALVVYCFVFVAECEHELGYFGVTSAQSIILLFSSYAVRHSSYTNRRSS